MRRAAVAVLVAAALQASSARGGDAPAAYAVSPTLRSMLVPGWGQLSRGRRGRGAAMGALWAGGVFGTWLAARAKSDAYVDYLADRESDALRHHFDLATRYWRLQMALTLASAGVWTWSVLDARFASTGATDGTGESFAPPTGALSLALGPAAAALRIRF